MKRLLLSALLVGLFAGCGKKAAEADAALNPASPTSPMPPPTEASDAAPSADAAPNPAPDTT
ncbi:MAG TPA: hypothetical protein PK095_25235, partial [Myxococcota bacterium]|nr:hypothetical protein [Myxococcota bacterium]